MADKGEVTCKDCGKPMRWIVKDGKYRPANPDGTDHDCRRKAARREAWLKAHGPMLREKAVLDRQFRKTVGGEA
jgi:hypothetical protein